MKWEIIGMLARFDDLRKYSSDIWKQKEEYRSIEAYDAIAWKL